MGAQQAMVPPTKHATKLSGRDEGLKLWSSGERGRTTLFAGPTWSTWKKSRSALL